MTETGGPDDQKRRVVANFNALVETYDDIRFVQVCARRLVELTALHPGARVLDVATGTGWAALAIAGRVGTTGMVLGVDLAPALLERAKQKVAAADLTNVEFRAGDAEQLDIADQRFDVVLCASSLFFVPDMLAALREWHRVLKPGGQVVFSGFGPTFGQPLMGLWEARLRQYGVSLPTERPGLRLAEPDTCRQLLHEAGFVQSEQLGYFWRTAAEWWEEVVWSSLNRLAVLRLAPAQREQFKAELLAEVEALANDQGIWVDVPVNFAFGWKSAAP